MWRSLANLILRYKYTWLFIVLAATAFFGWQASKVKLSYEFSKAIPTDNPKYLEYEAFKKKFGEGSGLLVIGVQTKNFFDSSFFNDYVNLQRQLKTVNGIANILSIPGAIDLVRDSATETLKAVPIFSGIALSKKQIDSDKNIFLNLPFYRGLLYVPETNAWLMALSVNNDVFNSPKRSAIVKDITGYTTQFSNKQKTEIYLSGLPLIRTVISDRIQREMRFFLIGSLILSGLILLLFFR